MFCLAKTVGAWVNARRCLSISVDFAFSLTRSNFRTKCSTWRKSPTETLTRYRKAPVCPPLSASKGTTSRLCFSFARRRRCWYSGGSLPNSAEITVDSISFFFSRRLTTNYTNKGHGDHSSNESSSVYHRLIIALPPFLLRPFENPPHASQTG